MKSISQQQRLVWLKRWIWIYFWLLIFEGALRKWVMPSLGGPLLLVRDPVAVIIYFQAYRCQKFSMKTMWPLRYLQPGWFCWRAHKSLRASAPLPVALYGLRSYVLHLPLIFIMADTLTAEDLHKFGRWLLLLAVPMMVLVLAQFRAASNTWLNAAVGEGGSQIMSAGNHVRPAGTFSYDVGPQCLVVLTASFIIDALMRKGTYPRSYYILRCLRPLQYPDSRQPNRTLHDGYSGSFYHLFRDGPRCTSDWSHKDCRCSSFGRLRRHSASVLQRCR